MSDRRSVRRSGDVSEYADCFSTQHWMHMELESTTQEKFYFGKETMYVQPSHEGDRLKTARCEFPTKVTIKITVF
jgi:hypothetical protein